MTSPAIIRFKRIHSHWWFLQAIQRGDRDNEANTKWDLGLRDLPLSHVWNIGNERWDPWKADRSEWRRGVQFLEAHPKYNVLSHLGGKIIILAVFIWAPGESKGQQYFLVVVAVPGTLMLNKKNALEIGDGVACSSESTVSLSWKNASPSLQPLTGDFPEEISQGREK